MPTSNVSIVGAAVSAVRFIREQHDEADALRIGKQCFPSMQEQQVLMIWRNEVDCVYNDTENTITRLVLRSR